MENLHYLLGIAWHPLPYEGAYKNGCLLVYSGDDNKVSLIEGPSPHYPSGVKSLREWFSFQPRYLVTNEGKNRIVVEAPGWFERICQEAGCAWFLPLAKQIAEGAAISTEEITEVYASHHQGRPMPRASVHKLIELAKAEYGW